MLLFAMRRIKFHLLLVFVAGNVNILYWYTNYFFLISI